jgi:circadian clock protein KaiB
LNDKEKTLAEFEEALANSEGQTFVLRLFISGASPRSTAAIKKIKEVCEEYLPGQYDLEIIDIYKQPQLATQQQIVAAPTLVKESPGGLRKLIGDLSNTRTILRRLGVVG